MNRTVKIYGVIILVVLLLLGLLEASKKKVVNWEKSYGVTEKSPFGLYVLDQEINHLLGDEVIKTAASPYNLYAQDSAFLPHNMVIIGKRIDQTSWKYVLQEVSKGSDLLYINEDIPERISDSLHFETSNVQSAETQYMKLTDAKFKKDSLYLDKFPEGIGFTYIDKNIEILGAYQEKNYPQQANFIKVKLGKGTIYFHTEPLFVTNYYVLKQDGSKDYTENVFSYLPKRTTYWFTDAVTQSEVQEPNALSFILSKPALRYAWWTFLAGLVLFVIFNAKRKQRIVPVIEPLKNKSVDFVKSIGNLYLQEGDFHDIMAKKAQYFLYRIRMDLLIDTQKLDDQFAHVLQLKTGASSKDILEAITLLKKAQDPYASVMKEDLLKMNALLDKIYK